MSSSTPPSDHAKCRRLLLVAMLTALSGCDFLQDTERVCALDEFCGPDATVESTRQLCAEVAADPDQATDEQVFICDSWYEDCETDPPDNPQFGPQWCDDGASGDGDGDGDGSECSDPPMVCDPEPGTCERRLVCPPQTPICEADDCVECSSDDHCAGDLCDLDTNSCAECLDSDDCGGTTPVCDGGACRPCAEDAECTEAGASVCAPSGPTAGQCVQCTLEREDACGGAVCLPGTQQCHPSLTVDSLNTCQPCEYDSQCTNGDLSLQERTHRCVPLQYKGQHRGGYCLKIAEAGCQKPYGVTVNAASLTGEGPEDYCGINQEVTTCEAVEEFGADACSDDGTCGAGEGDGQCATVSNIADVCTYFCFNDNECQLGSSCLCPDGSEDTCNVETEKYCQ